VNTMYGDNKVGCLYFILAIIVVLLGTALVIDYVERRDEQIRLESAIKIEGNVEKIRKIQEIKENKLSPSIETVVYITIAGKEFMVSKQLFSFLPKKGDFVKVTVYKNIIDTIVIITE
jgi:hypothetical protein